MEISLPSGFEFLDTIAESRSSFLAKVFDSVRQETVAFKLLKAEHFENEVLRQRFEREQETLAQLNHPHIVRFLGSLAPPSIGYSMEYLPSSSLRDILETKTQLPAQPIHRIVSETAEALSYAHTQGVVHRDIKPSNLMLDDAFSVRIIDFGAALQEDRTRLTTAGRTIGTPRYMSPEQVLGGSQDARSDQYALALVLFELLEGHAPFTHLRDHLTRPVPCVTKQIDSQKDWNDFFLRALAKNPDHRFADMIAFRKALRDLRPNK